MKILLIILTLSVLFAFSCEKETNDLACRSNCEEGKVTEKLKNVTAKVIRIWLGRDEEGKPTNDIYALTTDKASLDTDTWRHISESILVPCDSLPIEYQIPNLKIKVSGEKLECCNVIILPNIDGPLGCHLKITAIKKL